MRDVAFDLLQKYGPILSTDDLAEVFCYKNGKSVQEAIYRETFPSVKHPMTLQKLGTRVVASYIDVAQYLEEHVITAQPAPRDTDVCNASDLPNQRAL